MLSIFSKIISSGVRRDTSFEDAIRIKAMNRGILVGIGILVAAIFIGIDSMPFVWHMIAMILVLLFSLLFNTVGFIKTAHYFSAIAIASWLAVTSVTFGDVLGLEYYFLVILISLLTVLQFKNWLRILCAVLVTATLIAVKYAQRNYDPIFAAPNYAVFFYICSIVCAFTIVCIMCLNLLNDFEQNKIELLKSKRELEDSNQFKDKLFSIIGHDMKSPLTSLIACLQLLNDESLPADDRIFLLKELEDRTNRTMNVLSELVEWSSKSYFQSKHIITTERSPILVHTTVDYLFTFFKNTASQKNVSLYNDVATDFAVDADKDQLQFVLRNLVGNALKFSKIDGTGQVSVRSRKQGNKQFIEITDNGIGIPDMVKERLFNIDARITTDGTLNETGTGLGLIFCKEFIETNNGTLSIQSAEGIGTTITIEFSK